MMELLPSQKMSMYHSITQHVLENRIYTYVDHTLDIVCGYCDNVDVTSVM